MQRRSSGAHERLKRGRTRRTSGPSVDYPVKLKLSLGARDLRRADRRFDWRVNRRSSSVGCEEDSKVGTTRDHPSGAFRSPRPLIRCGYSVKRIGMNTRHPSRQPSSSLTRPQLSST